jgi:uncharacterized protein (DUF1015 family)
MAMADIAPVTPLRYDLSRLGGSLAAVVSPPYDVISAEQRAELFARHPHNVVRLILPEGDGDAKYSHAAALLAEWRDQHILFRDTEPAFYRLDQSFAQPGNRSAGAITRRGFLALVRLVPFADRVVLPHERTLSGPKEDRLKLFRATGANLSPGFMLYRDPRGELDAPLERGEILSEFSTPDGNRNTLAKVRDPEAIRAIVNGIGRSTLLIADGHHRYETALRYAGETSAAGHSPPDAEHRFFLTFLANGDSPDLVVFPTHRHVHSLPDFSYEQLLRRAGADIFAVSELPRGAPVETILAALASAGRGGTYTGDGASPAPSERGRTRVAFAAAGADGRAAVLTLRSGIDLSAHPTLGRRPAVLRSTDVVVLHAAVLESILGITPDAQAAKTNIWYPQDADAALGELRKGAGDALFLMNATPVAEVRAVAEAGEVMPQKSTFFYPKVPTGLALHTLDPGRRVALGYGAQGDSAP